MLPNERERKGSHAYSLLGPRLNSPTLEGLKLGDFVLKEYLGSGYSGDVYRGVTDGPTVKLAQNEPVAVKIYRNDLLDDQVQLERIHREARFGQSVTHPNLLKIYDLCETNIAGIKITYLVMEYLVGKSLADFLDATRQIGNKIALEKACTLGIEVFRGLRAIHTADEPHIHRDIKPQNIFLTKQEHIKIMDFGLIKPTSSKVVSFDLEFLGTVRYAAPEILFGGECDTRTDLYSGGAVLHELVFNEPIFWPEYRTANLVLAISKNKYVTPESPRNLDAYVIGHAIAKLLKIQPSERFSSALAVIEILMNKGKSRFIDELLRPKLHTILSSIKSEMTQDRREEFVEESLSLLTSQEIERVLLGPTDPTVLRRAELLRLFDPLELGHLGDLLVHRYRLLNLEERSNVVDRIWERAYAKIDKADPFTFDYQILLGILACETDPKLRESLKSCLRTLKKEVDELNNQSEQENPPY